MKRIHQILLPMIQWREDADVVPCAARPVPGYSCVLGLKRKVWLRAEGWQQTGRWGGALTGPWEAPGVKGHLVEMTHCCEETEGQKETSATALAVLRWIQWPVKWSVCAVAAAAVVVAAVVGASDLMDIPLCCPIVWEAAGQVGKRM